MSVLIKGMEMPKSRGQYTLHMYVHSDGTATVEGSYCQLEGEPFVAIPIPSHGDLIDTGAVDLSDGPYEYQDWVEWAWEQYLNTPIFLPADLPKEEKND